MASGTAASSALWKPLLLIAPPQTLLLLPTRAFSLSTADSKLLVLFQATIGSNGRPANGTVVYRGFQEDCDKIQIDTDDRSSKVEDIERCPLGEGRLLAVYDAGLRTLLLIDVDMMMGSKLFFLQNRAAFEWFEQKAIEFLL